MRRVILGGFVGGIVPFIGNAMVYIGDPTIDLYKQKTDQTFYDMYQNQESALGGQVQSNPDAKDYFKSVPTGNHFVEGKYLDRVKQSTVSGGQVPAGTETIIEVFGQKYRLIATENGLVVKNMAGQIVKKMEYQKIQTQFRQTSSVRQEAIGIKATFIPATGTLTKYTVQFIKTRKAYGCGKSTCYTPWSKPKIDKVIDVDTKNYNLADAILKGGLVIKVDDNDLYIQQQTPYVAPTIRPPNSNSNSIFEIAKQIHNLMFGGRR